MEVKTMFDPKHNIGDVVVLDDGDVGEIVGLDKLYIAPASGCRIPQWKGWRYHVLTLANTVTEFSESFKIR